MRLTRLKFLYDLAGMVMKGAAEHWADTWGAKVYGRPDYWWLSLTLEPHRSSRSYTIDPIAMGVGIRNFSNAADRGEHLGAGIRLAGAILFVSSRDDSSLLLPEMADAISQSYVFGRVRYP